MNCTWKTDNKTGQAGWAITTMERKRLHLKDIKAENQEEIKQQEGEGLYKSRGAAKGQKRTRPRVA